MSNERPGGRPGRPHHERPLPDPAHEPYERGIPLDDDDWAPPGRPQWQRPGGPQAPGGGGYRPAEPSGRHDAGGSPPTLRPSAPVQRPAQPPAGPPAARNASGPQRFGPQGSDRQGFDRQGFDRQGFDQPPARRPRPPGPTGQSAPRPTSGRLSRSPRPAGPPTQQSYPAPRPPRPEPVTEPAIDPVLDREESANLESGVDAAGRPATPPMVTGRFRRSGSASKTRRSGPPSGRVREIDTSGVRRGRGELVAPAGTETSPHQLLAPEVGGSIAFGLFSGVAFGLACVIYTAIVLSAPGITMSDWFKVAGGSNDATGKTQFYALSILLLVVLGIVIIPASVLAFRAARSLAFVKALLVLVAVVLAAYVTWYLMDAGAAIKFGSTSEWRGNWVLAALLTLAGVVTLVASFAGGAYLRARREFQARNRARRSRRL